DVYEMAAAYLFHLVRNHPFLDGNKRVGAVTALIFLDLNGYEFGAPEDYLADMVLAVARGEFDKADEAVFILKSAVDPARSYIPASRHPL
ncbi:MAG: type II toxin-antitoxin system death-on-curing family toxin, partial [Planctomycetaceae bacterium]|nr:type II toxin-antitoxin system death-on-curing family toxin [Planctomycetaceae bacterium]